MHLSDISLKHLWLLLIESESYSSLFLFLFDMIQQNSCNWICYAWMRNSTFPIIGGNELCKTHFIQSGGFGLSLPLS